MKNILGQSWRTSLIGYIQLILVTVYELWITKGETHIGHIILSTLAAIALKFSADSKQVKDVKKDTDSNTLNISKNTDDIYNHLN